MNTESVDFDLLPEVMVEVQDHLPELERDLHQLVQYPDSLELLASAFRHMHTIKGDFGYCRATPIMEYVHHLEGVMQSLRSRVFQCSALVAEALLQSMDLIHGMMQSLLESRKFGRTPPPRLIVLIDQLAQARTQPAADQAARMVLLSLHDPWQDEAEPALPAAPAAAADSIRRALALGVQLSEALVLRQPAWRGRSAMQLALVLALNAQYSQPSDPEVLEIAVYWHDVGLLAAPDQVLCHHPTQKPADWGDYVAHPERAASWLLSVAPDCSEAAQIIRQHHAWANGKGIVAQGYPHLPHQGAQMLACADLWFERIKGLSGEDYRRGMLRALFDVNGLLDSQFDALLINAFEALAQDFQLPAAHSGSQ